MNWFLSLLTQTDSVAHTVFLYAIVIAVGVLLGHIRIFGIALGVTFVLFAGIVAGHLGFSALPAVSAFLQDFGLILFVFCIGLQVGPSFFSSFKSDGIKMNLLSAVMIGISVLVMFACYYAFFDTSDPKNLPMMVGVLCGAVTNTPGLGAASEALSGFFAPGQAPQIASGYACAYPLGVIGIIAAMIVIRVLSGTSIKAAAKEFQAHEGNPELAPARLSLEVQNPMINGKTLTQIRSFIGRDFVVPRMAKGDKVFLPKPEEVLHLGDHIRIICPEHDAQMITSFIGPEKDFDWETDKSPIVYKRILVTRPEVNGRTFGSFHFNTAFGVNVTRVTRQGMELYAYENLPVQVGDRVRVVGPEDAIDRVGEYLGNSERVLDNPNMATIFIGILVGVIAGSIPLAIPGIPTPVKLGLAGGPLVIAILLGAWGYKFHLVTYTSSSANFMLRDFGLVLFLASVGLKAGQSFVATVVQGDGLLYVACGFLITVVPALICGIIACRKMKLNLCVAMGMLAGTNTNPPALAYASQTCNNDAPAIGYSTVYPLSMFLRIVIAQLIILVCM